MEPQDDSKAPDAPIAPGWVMGLDQDGNTAPRPLYRTRARKCMSDIERAALILLWAASIACSGWGLWQLILVAPHLFTAVAALFGHNY